MERPQNIIETKEYVEPHCFESDAEAVLFYAYVELQAYVDSLETELKKLPIHDVISSFCHHNGTYTTITDLSGNEVCCKCRKPLSK